VTRRRLQRNLFHQLDLKPQSFQLLNFALDLLATMRANSK
jgi:hypothetical protein